VNIEYLYASLAGREDKAVIILKVEDMEKGRRIMKEHKLLLVENF
jgi:hypothetical protein